MVSAIKSSFHNNLDSLPWMDKETQKKAAEKVKWKRIIIIVQF